MSTPEVDLSSPLSHVFFVTSWGYAADHYFAWIVKSLNCNPEILCYLANEGSRPKYFPEERTRAERPDVIKFAHFFADMGMTYTAIGDCYSYRPYHLMLLRQEFGDLIRTIHLTRHPYIWVGFYERWRSRNMRMSTGQTGPIEHEWGLVQHDTFKNLGLKPYEKKDIDIWATYQAMWILNSILQELNFGITMLPIESVFGHPENFQKLVSYLTHDRITYDANLIERILSYCETPFRGEDRVCHDPMKDRESWEDWKIEAFEKIVHPKTKQTFQALGYEL